MLTTGDIIYFSSQRARKNTGRRKYHLYVGRHPEPSPAQIEPARHVMLFINSVNLWEDYEIFGKDYEFFSNESSFVGLNEAFYLPTPEIPEDTSPVGRLRDEHLRELAESIQGSTTLTKRDINVAYGLIHRYLDG